MCLPRLLQGAESGKIGAGAKCAAFGESGMWSIEVGLGARGGELEGTDDSENNGCEVKKAYEYTVDGVLVDMRVKVGDVGGILCMGRRMTWS